MNESSKVIEYRINLQKQTASLYTWNDQSENEIKKTFPLTIASKRIQYLEISFTKEVQLTLWRLQNIVKSKDLNKWNNNSCLKTGRFNIVKMAPQTKLQIQYNLSQNSSWLGIDWQADPKIDM